jgi:glycerol-3-phosphate dehydrogenase
MVRDLRRLADTRFDVLVIGGGIYGAATAWDAAQRGLRVALIDRGDFGGGTSFNNLKTLHGGLRSLQELNLQQVRRFIRERRALARIAPHLVRPLPFVVPTGGNLKRSAWVMRAGLLLNDLIARNRNEGLADPDLHLPGGTLVSRDEVLRINPLIDAAGVTGGAVWFDYQMTNADRMTFGFVQSAVAAGAVAANYVSAEAFLVDGGRVTGARVKDQRDSQTFDVQASVVVNAAGAWAPELARSLPGGARSVPAPLLSRAMNVILRHQPLAHACGGMADGRFLFFVPWRDVSILGTSHDAHAGGADALTVTAADLRAFLDEGRKAFPRAHLELADVRLVHRGLLPMVAGRGHEVTLLRESAVVDHAAYGTAGLISIHGVRYTTARFTAAEAVDAVFRARGTRTPPASRTAETPLRGGDIPRVSAFIADAARRHPEVPPAVLARLIRTYGTDYGCVLQLATEAPHLAVPLGERCDVTALEIAYAARKEMAVTLADALLRRTEAGTAGHPGDDAIARAVDVLATELGWDERRQQIEKDTTAAFYRLPT